MNEPVEQLQRLKALLEQGVLAESAYQHQAEAILTRMGLGSAATPQELDGAIRTNDLVVDAELGPTDQRFRLLEPLGRGAMGEVWKAEELRSGRPWALKFVPAHLLRDPLALSRLRAEADRLTGLHHPHIVQTLGWREGAEGYSFIVMAYLAGESLRQCLLREERLDLDTALGLLRPVAAALDFAHERGIVHRDVKPENIMVADDGQVTLVDFGLSHPLRRSSTSSLASDRDVSGTKAYMPPEAFVGGGGAHHRKRDIYALAVVLYECLSGELPFDEPLVMVRPADLFPGCPEGLSEGSWGALKRGLHRDRAERPGTAMELLESVAADWLPVVESVAVAVEPGEIPFIHGWSTEQVQALQRETAAALGLAVMFQDRLRASIVGPEMMVIPAGRFLMGSPADEAERDNDERQHEVTIERPFALASCALTFTWYDRFCAMTGRTMPGDEGWGRGDRPVINVDWWDAVAFCEWLNWETGQLSEETGKGYRLATEAEWEYACRAGTTTAFWWGDEVIYTGQANYRSPTVEVRSFEANPWGLYQMHGNVREWVGSAWDGGYSGSELISLSNNDTNTPRVLRGGSWTNYPHGVRSAYRLRNAPGRRFSLRGFRLARSL